MNDRSEHSSAHLRAKLGEVVEATLQMAPNIRGLLHANVTSSLRNNVVCANVGLGECHSTTNTEI